jgi:hypothetical protein
MRLFPEWSLFTMLLVFVVVKEYSRPTCWQSMSRLKPTRLVFEYDARQLAGGL